MKLELQVIQKKDLKELYNIIYSSEEPEWSKLNAPYFNEYKLISFEQFYRSKEVNFYLSNNVRGIFFNNNLVGIVTRYWECRETRWLEIGIIIYNEDFWNKGIGYKALKEWIRINFLEYLELERIGLTTWSGNIGMMKLAEKLIMKLEGRLRKVRYYNNYYYDSLKYGILREEWEML